MKKRIVASMLVFVLCISLILPTTCFAASESLPNNKVVLFWKWENPDSELNFNESTQQWELTVSSDIQKDELIAKLPASVLATIADNGISKDNNILNQTDKDDDYSIGQTEGSNSEEDVSAPSYESETEQSDSIDSEQSDEKLFEENNKDSASQSEDIKETVSEHSSADAQISSKVMKANNFEKNLKTESTSFALKKTGMLTNLTLTEDIHQKPAINSENENNEFLLSPESSDTQPAPTPDNEQENNKPLPSPENTPESNDTQPAPTPDNEQENNKPLPSPENTPESSDTQPAPTPNNEQENNEPLPSPESTPESSDTQPAPTPDSEQENNEPQTALLELSWTIDNLNALADSEHVIAIAALPSGYSLGEATDEISVKVIPDAAILKKSWPPTCDWEKYEKFEVKESRDLSGTKINIFDYWTEADADGNVTEETRYNTDFLPYGEGDKQVYMWAHARFRQGINEATPFKFSEGGYRNACPIEWNDYNIWTGGKVSLQGIVKNVLAGRYPVIADYPGDFTDADLLYGVTIPWYDQKKDNHLPSLDYLFDPDISYSGKAAYENANGLLQVDKDGYYYDSTKNFAAFDVENFHLYGIPAVSGNNTDATKSGQFFPFNTPEQIFKIENGQLFDKKTEDVINETNLNDAMNRQPFINHYFGMTMTTRFAQKNGGKTYRGQETTYEFSGDDDVWVFIDDVLIADLGGIHDAAGLSINFTTGNVKVTGTADTTIREQFRKAGREGSEKDWHGNTFANDTYHTLRFFFLERGNNESNVKLKFNMVVIPESGIIKTDQFGNPVKDAVFSLYPAKVDAAGKYYPISKTPIYRGTTDKNGCLNLIDEETGGFITFEELSELGGSDYFILREESVPDGYRQNSDTYLHYDSDTDITVSENEWQTGSHSQTMMTATLKNTIHKIGTDGNPFGSPLKPYDDEQILQNGKFYAVVFRYMGDKVITDKNILATTNYSDWHPVIPNEDNEGWTVIDGISSSDEIRQAIEKKPYGTEIASDGSQKLQVSGLPGDPNSYYHLWSKKLAAGQDAGQLLYTVNFYYAANNSYQRLDPEDFGRDFSVRLFIPNIKNYLVVHKVVNANDSPNGAVFSLYKASDVEISNNGYTIKPGAALYDTVTTRELSQVNGDPINGNGCAIFPSPQHSLGVGDYYMIETSAPVGY